MNFNKLSREQKLINDLIYKTGLLNIEQIKNILNGMPEKGLNVILQVLTTKQYIDKQGDNYYPHGITDYISRENINCIWATINEISNREDFKTIEKAEFPSYYGCIVDAKMMYEIVSINEDNLVNIRQLQNRFYTQFGHEPIYNFKYIFVIEENKLLSEIENYNIQIPHKIVLLDYEKDNKRPVFMTFE